MTHAATFHEGEGAQHGALSPAEQVLAQSPEGAAKVQEYHRQLFHNASDALREEIKRITGKDVREADGNVQHGETHARRETEVRTYGTALIAASVGVLIGLLLKR